MIKQKVGRAKYNRQIKKMRKNGWAIYRIAAFLGIGKEYVAEVLA